MYARHIPSAIPSTPANGTVVVVDPSAMDLAHKKAGKTVYDSDWWVETLQVTLDHWGIFSRRWMDGATRVPRANFSLESFPDTGTLTQEQVSRNLTQPLQSGPLLSRLNSGPLGSGPLSPKDEKRP